jgi:tetratricopeptide (TPR) repeat protein
MASKLPRKNSAAKRSAAKKPAAPPAGGDAMRDLQRLMAKQNFESMEDIEAFMKEIVKGPIPKFEPDEDDDKEVAEELVYRAMEVDEEEARELLDEALMLDPDCIMAYASLAALETNPAISLAFYERGISIGSEVFFDDKYLDEHKGHFWMVHETRPFMRCLQGAAESHFYMGNVMEATMIWMELMELNPSDNQGVRFDLMAILAGLRDTEEFEKLDRMFKDDAAAATAFNRALYAFTSDGPGPKAKKMLDEAMRSNKHVLPLLLQNEPDLRHPSSYMLGSKEEAIAYLGIAHMIWHGVPGAIEWLKKVAPTKGRKAAD